jgi:hypothetical protein
VAPEIWYGIGALILVVALAFAVVRAGWLSPPERRRTDAATRDMQRQEEVRQDARDRAA